MAINFSNIKPFLIRLIGFVVIVMAGDLLLVITPHILIYLNLMPQDAEEIGFGKILMFKSMIVLLGASLLSFISLFIKENWRMVLYTCPLYAPCVFAIVYTLMNRI